MLSVYDDNKRHDYPGLHNGARIAYCEWALHYYADGELLVLGIDGPEVLKVALRYLEEHECASISNLSIVRRHVRVSPYVVEKVHEALYTVYSLTDQDTVYKGTKQQCDDWLAVNDEVEV